MGIILRLIETFIGLFFKSDEDDRKLANEPSGAAETSSKKEEPKEAPTNEEKEVKKYEEKVVYMISMDEILKSAKLEDQSQDIQDALKILLERINVIRQRYGKPMTVTSGLRTMEDHLRIYRQIAERKGVPFDESKVPMKSKHLFGKAVDIYDPDQVLQKWCKDNEAVLEEVGLWMEDFSATPNWCHFQIEPPRSGKRWFLP